MVDALALSAANAMLGGLFSGALGWKRGYSSILYGGLGFVLGIGAIPLTVVATHESLRIAEAKVAPV